LRVVLEKGLREEHLANALNCDLFQERVPNKNVLLGDHLEKAFAVIIQDAVPDQSIDGRL
jgi:hypothetical protein